MEKDKFIQKIERQALIFGWLQIACWAMALVLIGLVISLLKK